MDTRQAGSKGRRISGAGATGDLSILLYGTIIYNHMGRIYIVSWDVFVKERSLYGTMIYNHMGRIDIVVWDVFLKRTIVVWDDNL